MHARDSPGEVSCPLPAVLEVGPSAPVKHLGDRGLGRHPDTSQGHERPPARATS